MSKSRKYHIFFSLAVCYTIGLYFFYMRYVPIVRPFQIILLPLLLIVLLITALNAQKGTLLFIFLFPLINNLPYFYSIFEPLPHAPSALVLFLFYFLGWLVHNIFFKSKFSFRNSIFKPLILFSAFVILSGMITVLRYTNFYPFLSDYIYELTTNTNGVSAGGAIMSTVFNSLNYLSGFAFFFILLHSVKSKEFIKRILIILLASTFFAVLFGIFQHFQDIKIGNNPLSFEQGLINGTFKDALSFGAYLAAFVPVALSTSLFLKGSHKTFPVIVLILGIFILPHTGAKSSFICMIISLFLFLIFFIKVNWKKLKQVLTKQWLTASMILLLIGIVVVVLMVSFQKSIIAKRFGELLNLTKPGYTETGIEVRWNYRWKIAAQMIKDYPFTGVGMGAYIIEFPNYITANKMTYRYTDSAENYFLQAGSELGILALLTAVWVFLIILIRIGKSLGKFLLHNRWKYIQIGISCGIISLLINFFVHTYIGSYEIKYTFWLFVALLFRLSMSGEIPKKNILSYKSLKVVLAGIIIIFTCVFLWNSTHSLSLKSRIERFDLKQDFGLYQVEKAPDGMEFRWTRSYGGLNLKIKKPIISIPLLASHPDIGKKPIQVSIYLIKNFFKEKKLLDKIILNQNVWKTYDYHIPEEVNQEVILLLKVSRTWIPLRTLGVSDPRRLGVALGKIEFKDG